MTAESVLLAATVCPFGGSLDWAPWALLCAPLVGLVLAVLRHTATLVPWDRAVVDSPATLEWLQGLTLHAAFYTSAFAGVLGFQRCGDWQGLAAIVVIALLAAACAWACSWRRHLLAQRRH